MRRNNINELIKGSCPLCKRPFKILKRCSNCHGWFCRDCVSLNLCSECYNFINQKQEKTIYLKDKLDNMVIADD